MAEQKQEQGRQSLPLLYNVTKQQVWLTGGSLLASGVVDVLAHNGTAVVVGLAATLGVGYLSKEVTDLSGEVVRKLVPGSDAAQVADATARIINAVDTEEEDDPYKDQSPLAKMKRLIGMKTPPLEYAQGERVVTASAQPKAAETRVLQGEAWDDSWYDSGDDVETPILGGSDMFTLSQLLANGFVPSLQKIFLGRLIDGTDIYVAAPDLCHVALAGNTGGGKSSIMRLIMVQLCMIGLPVLLLNPHYMRYDRRADEDWTPFEPYLQQPPVECAKYEHIKYYLQWMAETLLPRRIERARTGGAVGKPYFIVIDELPAIVANVKEAPGYLAKILREGRKYGIYLIVAAQDFLAKTVAEDGEGAIRKLYRTAFYVGGDGTTAKTLLDMPANKIPETELGTGTIMLRCKATKSAVMASVPYVDNESLYAMLGPSTFTGRVTKEDEEVATSVSPSSATSVSPSGNTVRLSYIEGERNGFTGGAKESEVALPLRPLSELEVRVDELFFGPRRMNPAAIVRELWPDIKGGDAYQKKSIEVAEAIRGIFEARRGA